MIRFKKKNRGFTLIEIMIALLLVSSLGLLLTNYIRTSNRKLAEGERTGILEEETQISSRVLSDDISQTVFLNPPCDDNEMSSSTTLDCAELVIRGGVTPLPGTSMEDVDAMVNFLVPSNLEDDPATLTDDNDAIRLVLYDEDIECGLDRSIENNPSNSQERLWVDPTSCANEIEEGKLYILMESSGGVVFSSLFQVTDVDNVANPNEIEISSTGGSPFNVDGGLGIAGYSNGARIYSVKLVEYAVSSVDQGLWRREIKPEGTSDLFGYGEWILVQKKLESIQFSPVTVTSTGPVSHNRTMQFTANEQNDGLEDITGLSPRVVLKSDKADTEGGVYDNPITSINEADSYPRRELNFFVALMNNR